MNKLKLILVMLLWGSIGVFTRHIAASPILLAFLRALVAIPVLYIFRRIYRNNHRLTVKRLVPFVVSGSILGLAWVCLFTAFKTTSISVAVLVYNMCPVYVLILAPLLLKERLSKIRIMTIIVAFLGLFVIIGGTTGFANFNMVGLGLGVLSGLLYAALVIINRIVKTELDCSTGTLIQMVSATIILLPFVISENPVSTINKLDTLSVVLILILGLIHTGVAYRLYFSTYKKLSAVTIVSYSYLEPVFSIALSVMLLGEVLSVNQIIGGALILGSTYLGEHAKG
ncbi:MAG: DMT family transporter [Clostridia bacterium]|nr:DMT family transporter [Clostridia bacterium]